MVFNNDSFEASYFDCKIVMMWFGLVLFLFVVTTLVHTQDPRSRWSRQFAPQNTARQKDSGPPGFPHPIPEQRQVDVVPLEKGPFNQQDVSGPGNFRSRVPRPSNGGQTQSFDSQSQGESGKTKNGPSGMRKHYIGSADASAGLPDPRSGQLDKRTADTFGGFRNNKREPYRGPQFEVQQQTSNQLDMGGNMGVSLDTQIEAPAQLLDALSPPTFDPSLLFGSNRPPSSGPVKSDQTQSDLSQGIKGLFNTRPGRVDASESNLRSRVPTDRSGPTQMNAAKPESMGSPPVDPGTIAQGLIDVMDQTQMRAGGQGEVMLEGEIQIPTAILKAAVGVLGGSDTSGSTATDGSQFSGIDPSNKATQQRYDHSSQKSGFDGKLKRDSSPQQGVADPSRPDLSRRPGSFDPQSAGFDAFSRSERRPQGQFDLSRQQGEHSGFDQTGQQGGLSGFDASGQQGGQPGFDRSGQQGGQPGFGPSGQQGGQSGFDQTGHQEGLGGFDSSGQQGGQLGFDPLGQQGGQPSFDRSGQQGEQPSFDRTGQQGGQPSFDRSGQQGGQPSFDRSGQQGEQPGFDRSGQQGEQPGFDRSGQQAGQPSFDRSGQRGGQPRFDTLGQQEGQSGFDRSGPQGGQAGFDPSGQQGRPSRFDPSGQQGGQAGFDPSGQQGGQPRFDPSRQQGGQPSFDPSGQQGGQPSFDRSGQQGGQPSFEPSGQQGGQPSFDRSGQQGGQPSFEPSGQQGFDPSIRKDSGKQSGFDFSAQPEYIQRGSVDPSGQSYVGDHIVDRKSGEFATKPVGGDIIRPKDEQGFGQAPSMGAVKSNNVPRQAFVDTSRQDVKGQGGQSAAERLSALFGKCCFIIKKWVFSIVFHILNKIVKENVFEGL